MKSFSKYFFKFILIFCFLYFGTQLIIGLTVPGNHYSSFVHHYLDYISLLRKSLLKGSELIIDALGYRSFVVDNYFLKIENGSYVRMVYSCLGIGIFSFWAAFVIANEGKIVKKIEWVFIGVIIIWLINIARICLLLLAHNNKWTVPSFINHHTIFNIAAYGAVFLLMYAFDRSQKKLS
ncbi:exosortase/archaeosortase family protein [Ferruginibacter lapsinanis]|uniref:exosortase/archaeosortase family protein n=1 Tax=Ferruginibacter lapsinanis TaxID=563172 RepID=UPI001E2EAC15|nr:exosortase/archaeosortase family protein [Ferruginibacter lapsinanis]UEG49448.1 exosortase/archaeosortase family protein [Ferruginibacter lapsinanis]